MTRNRTVHWLTALTLAAGLVLAGCGDDPEPAPTSGGLTVRDIECAGEYSRYRTAHPGASDVEVMAALPGDCR